MPNLLHYIIVAGLLLGMLGIAVLIVILLHNRRKKKPKIPDDRFDAKQQITANELPIVSVEGQETEKTVAIAETEEPESAPLIPDNNTADTSRSTIEEPSQVKIEPIQRGGHPRLDGERDLYRDSQGEKLLRERVKPEVICWRRQRQWFLGVEIPEELAAQTSVDVYQDGTLLSGDDESDNTRILNTVKGVIKIECGEAGALPDAEVSLGDDDFLIFKLGGDGSNNGRLIRTISSGWFFVVVPDDWKLKDSDQVKVVDEAVIIPRYIGHCFYSDGSEGCRISFQKPSGGVIPIETKDDHFQLQGNRIAFPGMPRTPLFGCEIPQIVSLLDQGWANINRVVVGDEGGGKKGWRTQFYPESTTQNQDLPREIKGNKCGWYFARLYDNNLDLVESHDFKYVDGLKEIRVDYLSPFPPTDGHKPMEIEFVADDDLEILFDESASDLTYTANRRGNIFTIQPHSDQDEVEFRIKSQECGRSIMVSVLVERVWFNISDETDIPSQWRDRVVVLSRSDFTATTTKALWLKFPRPGWVRKIEVGFDNDVSLRAYKVKITENCVAIPLRDFCDSKVISTSQDEHTFKIMIDTPKGSEEGTVLIIPAKETADEPKPASVPGKRPRPLKRKLPAGYFRDLTLEKLNDLHDGQYVEHKDFEGVGVFRGIVPLPSLPGRHSLKVEYANFAVVYVELHNLSLVKHYVVTDGHSPRVKPLQPKKSTKKGSK